METVSLMTRRAAVARLGVAVVVVVTLLGVVPEESAQATGQAACAAPLEAVGAPIRELPVDAWEIERIRNARAIDKTARELGLPGRATLMALVAATRDSSVLNWTRGEGVGVFGLPAGQGWGTAAQLADIGYATRAFFGGPDSSARKGLLEIEGWHEVPVDIAIAAVRTDVAAEGAYDDWESAARTLARKAGIDIDRPGDISTRVNPDRHEPEPVFDQSTGQAQDPAGPAAGGNPMTTDGHPLGQTRDGPCRPAAVGVTAARVLPDGWVKPNWGRITSPFGWRHGRFHTGTDLAVWPRYAGAGVYAAHSGRVIFTGWGGAYGNLVMLDHGHGVTTRYAHMHRPSAVRYDQHVSAGLRLGTEGATGNATGIHLHYEVRLSGRAYDPEPFMRNRNVILG